MAALWSWTTIRRPVASSRVAGAVTTPSTATVPCTLAKGGGDRDRLRGGGPAARLRR